jgi:hypothetical protein
VQSWIGPGGEEIAKVKSTSKSASEQKNRLTSDAGKLNF